MHLRSHIFFKRQHPNNRLVLRTDLLQTGKNLRSTASKIIQPTDDNSISGLKPIQKPAKRAKLPGRRAIRHRINMPRNGRLRRAFPHFNIRKNISSRNARLRQTISFLCNLRGLGPAEVPVNSSAHFPSKNGSERRAPRHGIRRRESNLLKYREERPRHSAPNLLSTSR